MESSRSDRSMHRFSGYCASLGLLALSWVSTARGAPATQPQDVPDLPRPTRTDECEFIGGVPLGGIGAGTVEVRGDGSFREWQIFNNWGNTLSVGPYKYPPSYDLLNAFAAVRVDGKATVLETHPPDGLPGVAGIDYEGWFPFTQLKYHFADKSPVDISLEAFGSYVPHHTNDSGIPAIGLTWRLRNTSDHPVKISMAMSIVNPLGEHCGQEVSGKLHVVESVQGRAGVALAALDDEPVCIIGGADDASTLHALWDQFSNDQFKPPGNDRGQRIAQVVQFTLGPNEEKNERFTIGWFFPDHKENGNGPLVGHQYENWTASPIDSVNLLAGRFEDLRSASAKWRDTLRDSSWPEWINHWLCNNQYTLAKFTWWTKDGRFMDYESPGCPNGSPVHIIDLANWPVIDEYPELELGLLRQFAAAQRKNGSIPEEFSSKGTTPSITFVGGRDLTDVNPKFILEIYHRWRETGDTSFLNATWPACKRAILYCSKFDKMGLGLPSGPKSSSTWDHWNNKYLFSYSSSVYLAGLRAAEELAKVQNDPAFATEMHGLYETGLTSMNTHLWNGEFYAMNADQNLKQDNLSFVESTYGDDFSRFVGLGPILPDDKALATLRAIAKFNNQPTRYGLVVSADKSGKMVRYNGDDHAQITVCHAIPAPIALIQEGEASDVDTGLRILRQMYDLGAKHPGALWNLPHHVVADTGERHARDFGHYMRDRALWALLKVLNGWNYDAPDQSLAIGPVLTPEHCHGPWICSKAYGTLAQEIVGSRQTLTLTVKDGELDLKQIELRTRIGSASSLTATRDGKIVEADFKQEGERLSIRFAEPIKLPSGDAMELTAAAATGALQKQSLQGRR